MAKHRRHSIAFKRQIAQAYLAGETVHGLARDHGLSRSLIRIWVDKFKEGAFDEDAEAIDLVRDYEAKIAALERLVGRQTFEIEFLEHDRFSWKHILRWRCSWRIPVARSGRAGCRCAAMWPRRFSRRPCGATS